MRAWVYQDHKQKPLGDKGKWSVGWIDPDGHRKAKRIGSKSQAEKRARKIEGQLAAGVYLGDSRKTWKEFRQEFEDRIANGMVPNTKRNTLDALDAFERHMKPAKLQAIKTTTIDDFVSRRRTDKGRQPKSTVSPATINKDLRHLKAVLRIAHEWGYLPLVPKVRMLREPKKLPQYVTPEHFAAMYKACTAATEPAGLPYSAADWWRAVLTMCYMTGWRIGEVLSLRRSDLDMEAGIAITRWDDNKGKRDERVPLHPVVVQHLELLPSFHPLVFPWIRGRRDLWQEFATIQKAASIKLECADKHEHTDACHRYGFHDLRRAFATLNAERLSATALQGLMRHQSFATTQRYINMARQLNGSVEALHVPEVLRVSALG